MALGGGDVDAAGGDTRVIGGDDLAAREIRAERRQHGGRRNHPADMRRALIEEAAPIQRAMNIGVEQVQHLARIIGSARGCAGVEISHAFLLVRAEPRHCG